MDEQLEQILMASDNITNDDKKLSIFFGKCAMARLLEVFLNNPNKLLNVEDVLIEAGLSRKAIVVCMPFLIDNNMIVAEEYKFYKFYKLNSKNVLVKQISEFRNILLVNINANTTTGKSNKNKKNRQINPKHAKKRGTRKSKNAGRAV